MSAGPSSAAATAGGNTSGLLLHISGVGQSVSAAAQEPAAPPPHMYADCSVSAEQTLVDTMVETAAQQQQTDGAGRLEYGVMLSDTDVSNGFVKDGTSLPYVFEANESGARKRSTKILPVCGMCGKKFVCVTTMKRHLVTHTGEKPFSCKVCGKQYTQKGNLRVHERTHRNDRPFECNICTQKFYRKEPMQKHQWRQHGIVHLKSRPTNSANNANTNSSAVIGAEGMLYKSLNMDGSNGGINHQAAAVAATVVAAPEAALPEVQTAASYQIVDAASLEPLHQHQTTVPGLTDSSGLLESPVAYIVQSTEDEVQYASIEVYTEEPDSSLVVQGGGGGLQESITLLNPEDIRVEGFATAAATTTASVADTAVHEEEPTIEVTASKEEVSPAEVPTVLEDHDQENQASAKPVKLKMKLAQAYLKEIEESREHELMQERMSGGRDQVPVTSHPIDISNIQLTTTSLETATTAATVTVTHPSVPDQVSLEAIVAKLTLPEPQPAAVISTEFQEIYRVQQQNVPQPAAAADHPDTLEFLCKSCGSKCQVSDPYSFRCGTCNMKYTSLPTHLIAEPLQCIGCVQIFPHKPALKQHQSSGVKERPFKCCKCGFEFRQKAHLQKHQWRIHRKKYDTSTTEPTVSKDAEIAIGSAAVETSSKAETVNAVATAPVAEVHRLVADQEASPLDLSPAKMYGTAGSITKWVEQVETARTPMKPDISIHKKQAGEEMVTFKDILSRPPVNQLKDQVQLQIINPLNGGKQESLTLHLVDKKGSDDVLSHHQTTTTQLPVYAVKSCPQVIQVQHLSDHEVQGYSTNTSRDLEENPLINQIVAETVVAAAPSSMTLMPPPAVGMTVAAAASASCPRSPKRARTEEECMMLAPMTPTGATTTSNVILQAIDTVGLHQPADLSLSSGHSTSTPLRTMVAAAGPLAVKTTPPLRLETQYSTVSPPLNLSSSAAGGGRSSAGPQVSPYDYRISKSAGISGHFQRLKSQDERSGI